MSRRNTADTSNSDSGNKALRIATLLNVQDYVPLHLDIRAPFKKTITFPSYCINPPQSSSKVLSNLFGSNEK